MRVLYIGGEAALASRIKEEPNVDLEIKSNGFEALKLLEENNEIDIVCTEYDLPGNDGLYILNKIKSSKALRGLPCILLQTQYNPVVLKEAFENGIEDYYILKLHSIEQIIERMKSLHFPNPLTVRSETKETKTTCQIPWSKRLFDIVAASSLLLVLSPVLLITMIAIRLESKGKIYYTSKRVGRKTFDFYKFRSMRVGADKLLKQLAKKNNQYAKEKPQVQKEESTTCSKCAKLSEGNSCSPLRYDGEKMICDRMYLLQQNARAKENSSFIKIVDDPRITKIGKFIRNTSIDELPQLINVIKGDMSLVGNRPLPVYEAETLTKDQLSKRFLAPAGITGLWQVELRGKGGDMSEEERIELDNKYADYFTNNSYSFWFDLKILLRTVPALFQQSTV